MADTVFAHAYNNLKMTLGEAIDNAVTDFDLGSGDGAKLDAALLPVIITIGVATSPATYEMILLTAFTGDHVDNCTRGYLSAGLGATAWPDGQEIQNRTAAQEINQFLDALETGWEASACDPILNDIRALGIYRAGSGNIAVTDSGGHVLLGAISQGGAAVGQNLQWNGTTWAPASGAGTGDVTGPGGATDNAVARFDLATGKLIQDSTVLIDDSGNITIPGTATMGSGANVITTAVGLVLPSKIDQEGATTNQSLVWTGAAVVPTTVGAPNGTATDNAVPRFDGTTGILMQDSGVLISDGDNMTLPGSLTAGSGSVLVITTAGEVKLDSLEQDGAANNEVMTWNQTLTKWQPSPITAIGITGPVSTTLNAVPRWADTVGDTLADSGVLIDGSNNVTLGGVSMDGVGGTFALLDANITTLNFARAVTNIQMGSATGSTTIRHALNVTGDITASSEIIVGVSDRVTVGGTETIVTDGNHFQSTQQDVSSGFGFMASRHGGTAIVGGEYATARSRGSSGTPTVVQSGDRLATFYMHGYDGAAYREAAQIRVEVSTTPGSGDMPGKMILMTTPDGSTTPTAALTLDHNQDATFSGDIITDQTTVDLLNATVTTLNIGGAASAVNIGAGTSIVTLADALTVEGTLNLDGGILATDQTTANLVDTVATTINFGGAATAVHIGAATGTTAIHNAADIDGNLNVDGGSLTTNQTTFNLLDGNATVINLGGAATTLDLGSGSGTTTVRNALTVINGFVSNAAIATMSGLPTSDPSITGRLWNDSGTMKISA